MTALGGKPVRPSGATGLGGARTPSARGALPFLGTALVLVLAGCAALRGRGADREVVVDLPVSRAEAVRRTLATFREQGYKVRESLTSGTQPETEPFRHRDDADVVFRAAISGSGQASRVVFSGTYQRRELGGLVHGGKHAVRESDNPLERELWARLENLALMLRRAAR